MSPQARPAVAPLATVHPTASTPHTAARRPRLHAPFLLLLLALAFLPLPTRAVHFYLEGTQQKCFTEDLPKDTTVHGDFRLELWKAEQKTYVKTLTQVLQVTVEEVNEHHRLLNQAGGPDGKFAFTTTVSGELRYCFKIKTEGTSSSDKTRIYLDLHVGDADGWEDDHKDSVNDLVNRIKELRNHAALIQKEQTLHRENEAKFRDVSELTNGKVVYWTIIQLFVIACTGIWQIRHLKGFFTAKKLV